MKNLRGFVSTKKAFVSRCVKVCQLCVNVVSMESLKKWRRYAVVSMCQLYQPKINLYTRKKFPKNFFALYVRLTKKSFKKTLARNVDKIALTH